jgi:hypothetical protein
MRACVAGLAVTAALAGCRVSSETFVETDAGLDFVEVSSFPMTPNDDLDLLFVLDDSPGTITVNASTAMAFPTLVSNLKTTMNVLPNLHLGVITGDMGTTGGDNIAGPAIGSGPGACSGSGKSGNLRIGTAQITSGVFLSDVGNSDLTRTKNYTSSIEIAFNAMANVGGDGCEYEQPLLAARRALDRNLANVNFLRPSAALAIVFVTNEDDCSFKSSGFLLDNSFGALTSFRCTRTGITCDYGGATPADMDVPGPKASCHSNDAGPLVPLTDFIQFFKTLKPEPRMVAVRNIAAPVKNLAVEMRPAGPALQHACSNGVDGDPAVRLDQVADAISPHRTLDACVTGSAGYDAQMTSLGQQLSALTGRSCFDRDIPMGTECIVEVNGQPIVQCGTTMGTCYKLNLPGAVQGCPFASVTILPAGMSGWGTVRCRL